MVIIGPLFYLNDCLNDGFPIYFLTIVCFMSSKIYTEKCLWISSLLKEMEEDIYYTISIYRIFLKAGQPSWHIIYISHESLHMKGWNWSYEIMRNIQFRYSTSKKLIIFWYWNFENRVILLLAKILFLT